MMDTLEQEMHKYFMQLDEPEKKSIILMLKTLVMGRSPETSEGIDIELYNKEIDEAIARVEAGQFFTHEEVEKMSNGW